MDIRHGIFKMHPVNYGQSVEVHFWEIGDGISSPSEIVFEARPWSEWREWLGATVGLTSLGIAELAMHDGRDWSLGQIDLKIPEDLKHRNVTHAERDPHS